MTGYSVGRQNGWLSANDIREMEDMNPIPAEEGGDLYLVNGNLCRLEDAGLFAGKNMQEPEPLDGRQLRSGRFRIGAVRYGNMKA